MAADGRAYDTTASTYERDRRRHLAVPLKALAAARALLELSAIYPLLAATLAPTAAADDDVPAAVAGLRLVESGLLLTLPGAAAQRAHADTDGSGREEGAPLEATALKIQLGAHEVRAEITPRYCRASFMLRGYHPCR